MDEILILDFGSQTTQLIGRRIRELGVYSEVLPCDSSAAFIAARGAKGIILSGSPASVYEDEAPRFDPEILKLGLPVLGICYGIQRMTEDFGGKVGQAAEKEYGRVKVTVSGKDPLLKDLPDSFLSWMSHGDSILAPAPHFDVIGVSEHGHPAVLRHRGLPYWGLQFHPEASHCEFGNLILENFAVGIAGSRKEWTMERYAEELKAGLVERIGASPVLLLISGGVDSTVAAALLLKSLNPAKVHLMYINTGLMRKDESAEVMAGLERLGAKNLYRIDAEAEFLGALGGTSDPEEKRRIIGDLFIKIQQREVEKLLIPGAFLAQGTLYTDLIESGKGIGKKARVIKSHHNVRSPLVEAKRAAGLVVEPLDRLYKDEVRALGRLLGISEFVVARHPFPGPGLGVRILGEVTKEKCDILREADSLFISELKRRGLYDEIWQAFCVLLPVRSVGVGGDVRKYGHVIALRAIISKDGMTADVYPFLMKDLLEISSLITNSVPEIGRVVYDISSKPPATIEWE